MGIGNYSSCSVERSETGILGGNEKRTFDMDMRIDKTRNNICPGYIVFPVTRIGSDPENDSVFDSEVSLLKRTGKWIEYSGIFKNTIRRSRPAGCINHIF